jgi:UDP-N-acetylglucosamine/UDP-N-acetylgalactosamine diphosphorylase
LDERYRVVQAALAARRQEHVLRWWSELDAPYRARLLSQLESIPWELVDRVIPTHVLAKPRREVLGQLVPAPVMSRLDGSQRKAEKVGRKLLEAGAVAAFTVAGGQATRLGVDVPKGTIPVTPVGEKSLFGLFAMMVAAARDRYGANIPWYIMTSEANHEATLAYFTEHLFFGLPPADVVFFRQGMLPTFGLDGRLMLDRRDSLALAPDGHGGSLKAMVKSGALADMRKRGVKVISYFQVDNPLVKPFDPLFLGLHRETGSEMSTKVARKADDLERVGNVCLQDGKVTVIEYSEFPEELARAKNDDGTRKFDAANLAIHALDVGFVGRIAGDSFQLPFRRAEKAVPCIDDSGNRVVPDKPNAVKLETFIFDALPLARNPLLLEADRAEEFSPVKNATGPDSLATSMRDQIARAVHWLSLAGVSVPRNSSGDPDVIVAISPRFALDALELKGKTNLIPDLRPGDCKFIE